MNWSARVWSRQTHSAVSLMALTFFMRNSPSARLRRDAMACGPFPAQAWLWSSWYRVSRT